MTHGAHVGRRAALAGAAFGLLARRAGAADTTPLKIGVLNDQSGIVADLSGLGTVAAIGMAAEDFGPVLGRRVEVLAADHKNKADLGAAIARQWYDDGVSAIFDLGITTVALAVQSLTREKDRVVIFLSSASSDLTGKSCSPNGIHWTYNSYSQAIGEIRYLSANHAKTWYFLTVDYTYGRNVQRDATAMIEAAGGRVLGATTHAFETSDFSASLLSAKASRADAIALATTTGHAVGLIKQAEEFGIRAGGQQMVPLSLTLHDIKSVGLQAAQGMIETAPYYWDQNDAARGFAERYRKRVGKMPNMVQASAYGAAMHYFKAVQATGSDAASGVLARMKATPINDFMTVNGEIRADGRVMRTMYILQIKSPAESSNEWDLEKIVGTIPGSEAFQPADPALCPLVKS